MYWKRFAALATGYANRYRFDGFFRTETNIVALQITFALTIGILMWASFSHFYTDISDSVRTGVVEGVALPTEAQTRAAILLQIEDARERSLAIVVVLLLGITTLFAYLIARITLVPARNSLAAQKQFIGNIAHELRTPLSIIKTNIEVAMLDEYVDPKLAGTLKSNLEELDRISDIINNLLSFSVFVRPERMEFSDVDLGTVVDTTVAKLMRLVDRKHIELVVRKGDFRIVRGNATALEQIVMNILKNAIMYTGHGGTIAITLEPDYRDFIGLTVGDSGIGIARKDLFRIFEPFYRAEHSRARRYGGTGLGLAIVNELVKIHRGKIVIRSAPGKGTTVIVSLPCGENAPPKQSETLKHQPLDEIAVDFSGRS